jgi:hypothetical protein
VKKQVIGLLEQVLTTVTYNKAEESHCEIVNRVLNMLSKLSRDVRGAQVIAESKNLLLRVILYFNLEAFPQELVFHSLRILHNCFKSAPNFRSLYLETHSFTVKNLDTLSRDLLAIFNSSLASGDNDSLINGCSCVSALNNVFPETSHAFASMIVPLINIVKEKVDGVRKTAAVCLAKISRDEENAKIMRANHGTEVLVSLSNVLASGM